MKQTKYSILKRLTLISGVAFAGTAFANPVGSGEAGQPNNVIQGGQGNTAQGQNNTVSPNNNLNNSNNNSMAQPYNGQQREPNNSMAQPYNGNQQTPGNPNNTGRQPAPNTNSNSGTINSNPNMQR